MLVLMVLILLFYLMDLQVIKTNDQIHLNKMLNQKYVHVNLFQIQNDLLLVYVLLLLKMVFLVLFFHLLNVLYVLLIYYVLLVYNPKNTLFQLLTQVPLFLVLPLKMMNNILFLLLVLFNHHLYIQVPLHIYFIYICNISFNNFKFNISYRFIT